MILDARYRCCGCGHRWRGLRGQKYGGCPRCGKAYLEWEDCDRVRRPLECEPRSSPSGTPDYD